MTISRFSWSLSRSFLSGHRSRFAAQSTPPNSISALSSFYQSASLLDPFSVLSLLSWILLLFLTHIRRRLLESHLTLHSRLYTYVIHYTYILPPTHLPASFPSPKPIMTRTTSKKERKSDPPPKKRDRSRKYLHFQIVSPKSDKVSTCPAGKTKKENWKTKRKKGKSVADRPSSCFRIDYHGYVSPPATHLAYPNPKSSSSSRRSKVVRGPGSGGTRRRRCH